MIQRALSHRDSPRSLKACALSAQFKHVGGKQKRPKECVQAIRSNQLPIDRLNHLTSVKTGA